MKAAGWVTLAVGLAPLCTAVELTTARSMDVGCSIPSPASVFMPTERDVFVRVSAHAYRATDQIKLEWLDAEGALEQQVTYQELPPNPNLCLVSHLFLAGSRPASKPGTWKVRLTINGHAAAERSFHISAAQAPQGSIVESVIQHEAEGERTLLQLQGSGFVPGSVVHIARFTASGEWRYVAAELPFQQSGTSLSVLTHRLEPGEYVAVLRAVDGSVSQPARFLLQTGGGYQVPVAAGERWVITQRPYGSFSHWDRSLHAWDIAPENGGYVVAMRSGIARTRDSGLHQTPHRRSFGNYISIEHPDGEFSHYAHLATGSFLVKDGDRVQQGQPLARVGNSGYTLGPGGGYHVHVHVTRSPLIAAQSIPFEFGTPGTTAGVDKQRQSVQVAEWWTRGITVPAKAAALTVQVRPEIKTDELDLHVTGPDGKRYGPLPQRSGSPTRGQENGLFRWRECVARRELSSFSSTAE